MPREFFQCMEGRTTMWVMSGFKRGYLHAPPSRQMHASSMISLLAQQARNTRSPSRKVKVSLGGPATKCCLTPDSRSSHDSEHMTCTFYCKCPEIPFLAPRILQKDFSPDIRRLGSGDRPELNASPSECAGCMLVLGCAVY